MNAKKIIYWIFTGLICVLMLFSASLYLFSHEQMNGEFIRLQYPTYLIYPLATAKILGVLALLTKKSILLKNLAYAGIFFNLILAGTAHYMAGDPIVLVAIGLICLSISFFCDEKLPHKR